MNKTSETMLGNSNHKSRVELYYQTFCHRKTPLSPNPSSECRVQVELDVKPNYAVTKVTNMFILFQQILENCMYHYTLEV